MSIVAVTTHVVHNRNKILLEDAIPTSESTATMYITYFYDFDINFTNTIDPKLAEKLIEVEIKHELEKIKTEKPLLYAYLMLKKKYETNKI